MARRFFFIKYFATYERHNYQVCHSCGGRYRNRNRPELYEAVDKQPGESVYSMAKAMSWSNGKTYAAARRLERAGMVHIEKAERNGRYVLIIKSKT